MTRIELLYFDDCPNHEPLLARVRELVAQHGARATIEPVRIDSDEEAQAHRFLGSPTLRVDGADVEPGADERPGYGLKCRLYRGAGCLTGSPDDAWIVAALNSAASAQRSGEGRDSASPAAAALARIGLAPERSARAAALDGSHRRLYQRILATFAAGERPSAHDIRSWSGELRLDDTAPLQILRSADLIGLDAGGSVTVAYPFSARPTRHRVSIEGGPDVWAMCAIDALGIPFMLDRPVAIHADEPGAESAIEVSVDPASGALSADPTTAVVLAASRGQASSDTCRCPFINFFATAARAERYLASRPELTGETLTLRDAVAMGRLHFGGLLEAEPTPIGR
jgi:hypothetical protein